MGRSSVLGGCLLGMILIYQAPQVFGDVSTINFDSIDTSGGSVVGQPVLDYLAPYGITVSTTPGGVVPLVAASGYNQSVASSPLNLLTMGGLNNQENNYMTLNFSTNLSEFSFTRCAEITGPNSWAQWSATAYNGSTQLGSVGEGMADFIGNSAGAYSLAGPNITSVTFEENTYAFAGNGVCFDDVVMTSAIPEPASALVILLGSGFLAIRLRWRKIVKPHCL